jgi:hypothetical protein
VGRRPRLPPEVRDGVRAAEQAGRAAARGLTEAGRALDRVAMGVASEWRRVLKSEDAAANAANRYIRRAAESYSRDFTIAERQFRRLREGVTVERAIEERRVRLRPYASQEAQRAAERTIERNRKDPIRAYARMKRKRVRRATEKDLRAQDEWFRGLVEKKSGVRWRFDNNGKLAGEQTGRKPADLTADEFERAVKFYRANDELYAPMESDLFRRTSGPSLKVSRRAYRSHRRAA